MLNYYLIHQIIHQIDDLHDDYILIQQLTLIDPGIKKIVDQDGMLYDISKVMGINKIVLDKSDRDIYQSSLKFVKEKIFGRPHVIQSEFEKYVDLTLENKINLDQCLITYWYHKYFEHLIDDLQSFIDDVKDFNYFSKIMVFLARIYVGVSSKTYLDDLVVFSGPSERIMITDRFLDQICLKGNRTDVDFWIKHLDLDATKCSYLATRAYQYDNRSVIGYFIK